MFNLAMWGLAPCFRYVRGRCDTVASAPGTLTLDVRAHGDAGGLELYLLDDEYFSYPEVGDAFEDLPCAARRQHAKALVPPDQLRGLDQGVQVEARKQTSGHRTGRPRCLGRGLDSRVRVGRYGGARARRVAREGLAAL